MAVHERRYHPYLGEHTPAWLRFLVLPSYAYREVFKPRLFTGFFFACFAIPLGLALIIYLTHNLPALEVLGLDAETLIPINEHFFHRYFLFPQGVIFGFVLTLIVGPALRIWAPNSYSAPASMGIKAEHILTPSEAATELLSVKHTALPLISGAGTHVIHRWFFEYFVSFPSGNVRFQPSRPWLNDAFSRRFSPAIRLGRNRNRAAQENIWLYLNIKISSAYGRLPSCPEEDTTYSMAPSGRINIL